MEFTTDTLKKLKTKDGKAVCITQKDTKFLKALKNLKLSDIKGVSKRSVYYWKKQERPIPLKHVISICKDNDLAKINIDKLSINGGNSITFFPKKDKELYYILGLILGDGCLSIARKQNKSKSYTLQISFKNKKEAEHIEEIIGSIFGINGSIYQGTGCYNLCIFSKPLLIFLNQEYDIPIGKKYERIKVPEKIKNYQKNATFFIKGLFDSDGNIYIHREKKCIQFRQKSGSFTREVKELMEKQGISICGPYYDKANNSWVLWSNKKEVVDIFINKIESLNI